MAFVFVLFLGMGFSNYIFAQFKTASITENILPLSMKPQNVNNDIWEDGISSSYRVTVYSDENSLSSSTAGIYWDVFDGTNNYSSSEFFNTQSSITDMKIKYVDVSILKDVDNTDIHAIVCYSYTSLLFGDGWIVEDFIWNGTKFTPNPNLAQLAIASGRPGYTIHIDANNNGDFIIVYDDINGDISCITGRVENSLSVANNGVSLNSGPFLIFTEKYSPDVSMSNDGGGENYVYVSLTNYNTQSIEVYDSYYPVLTTGASGFSPSTPQNTLFDVNEVVYTSRIASPNSNGAAYEYTVVYNTTDAATRNIEYIKGYNNSTTNNYVYNNGLTAPSNQIYSVPNRWPVVTYNSNHNVLVGWVWSNTSGAYTVSGSPIDAQYPLVLPCDNVGAVTVSDYWIVPTAGSIASGDEINLLAISGKHAIRNNEDYISYNHATDNNLLTKWADVDIVSSLRNSQPSNLNLQDSKTNQSNNLIGAPINFYIFDLMGRTISKSTIDGRDINIYLNQQSRRDEGVLQVYRIEKLDGTVVKTGKF